MEKIEKKLFKICPFYFNSSYFTTDKHQMRVIYDDRNEIIITIQSNQRYLQVFLVLIRSPMKWKVLLCHFKIPLSLSECKYSSMISINPHSSMVSR